MSIIRLLLLSALLLTSSLLTACGENSPIIIGFSGQLTGKLSDLGVYGRNGAMLAIEKINSNGGINGRKLKLITKDDRNTPEGALQADKELIEAGAVAIIGHMTSSQTMAVMPLVNETGIVIVSPTTSTPKLTGITDSFFRTIMENPAQSRELAHYAHSAMDINTIVIVAEEDNKSYSFSFNEGFSRSFESLEGQIVDRLTYSASQTADWDPIIDAVIAQNPDAVLLTCPAQDAVSIIQRLRNSGLKTQILSSAWAYTDQIIKWGGQYVEDVIFVIDYAADNPNPEFIKFRESYKNRFGNLPNFASAFSYEAVMTLAAGLEKTGGSAEGLADAMAPSKAITGVISRFKLNEFGDVERNIFIATIQDGEFRTVEMR